MVVEPEKLFAAKANSYARYIALFFYPQGLQAFFTNAEWLRNGLRVMDAGCGTGVVTLGFLKAMKQSSYEVECINAFDLTPEMLELFRTNLKARHIQQVDLQQANVLELEKLPLDWTGYDLIITASMLEYIPKDKLAVTLANLRARLNKAGRLILFMTRRNWLTTLLVKNPWGGNRYSRAELASAFAAADFKQVTFKKFPWNFGWLNLWGHIVEARAN